MPDKLTAKEAHAALVEYFKSRRDLGLWKAFLNLLLEPQNPFEPKTRRKPRQSFVLAVVVVGLPTAAFVYFNFWL
jgi:hypothetical protein